MTEVRQNFRDLSQGMKILKGLIFDAQLRHGDNQAFRWMLSNVAARVDENENIAPSKKKASERIDGVVATIMAIARSQSEGPPPVSKYETEDLLVV